MMTVTEVMRDAIHGKRTEPVKRKCAGHYQWVHHRFPIKGGISLHDCMLRDMATPVSGWAKMLANAKEPWMRYVDFLSYAAAVSLVFEVAIFWAMAWAVVRRYKF